MNENGSKVSEARRNLVARMVEQNNNLGQRNSWNSASLSAKDNIKYNDGVRAAISSIAENIGKDDYRAPYISDFLNRVGDNQNNVLTKPLINDCISYLITSGSFDSIAEQLGSFDKTLEVFDSRLNNTEISKEHRDILTEQRDKAIKTNGEYIKNSNEVKDGIKQWLTLNADKIATSFPTGKLPALSETDKNFFSKTRDEVQSSLVEIGGIKKEIDNLKQQLDNEKGMFKKKSLKSNIKNKEKELDSKKEAIAKKLNGVTSKLQSISMSVNRGQR